MHVCPNTIHYRLQPNSFRSSSCKQKLHTAPLPVLGTPPQPVDTLFQEAISHTASKDQSITDKTHFSGRCILCPEYYGLVDRSTYSPVSKSDDPAGVFCLFCRIGVIHGKTAWSRSTEILRNPTSITTLPSNFSVPSRLSVWSSQSTRTDKVVGPSLTLLKVACPALRNICYRVLLAQIKDQ
jgi:hypothetical protein